MRATITSKGQVTIPKEVRDQLKLDAETVLDFFVMPDNTIIIRAIKPDARKLRGLLKSPHARALTVEELDAGIAQHARAKLAGQLRGGPRDPC